MPTVAAEARKRSDATTRDKWHPKHTQHHPQQPRQQELQRQYIDESSPTKSKSSIRSRSKSKSRSPPRSLGRRRQRAQHRPFVPFPHTAAGHGRGGEEGGGGGGRIVDDEAEGSPPFSNGVFFGGDGSDASDGRKGKDNGGLLRAATDGKRAGQRPRRPTRPRLVSVPTQQQKQSQQREQAPPPPSNTPTDGGRGGSTTTFPGEQGSVVSDGVGSGTGSAAVSAVSSVASRYLAALSSSGGGKRGEGAIGRDPATNDRGPMGGGAADLHEDDAQSVSCASSLCSADVGDGGDGGRGRASSSSCFAFHVFENEPEETVDLSRQKKVPVRDKATHEREHRQHRQDRQENWYGPTTHTTKALRHSRIKHSLAMDPNEITTETRMLVSEEITSARPGQVQERMGGELDSPPPTDQGTTTTGADGQSEFFDDRYSHSEAYGDSLSSRVSPPPRHQQQQHHEEEEQPMFPPPPRTQMKKQQEIQETQPPQTNEQPHGGETKSAFERDMSVMHRWPPPPPQSAAAPQPAQQQQWEEHQDGDEHDEGGGGSCQGRNPVPLFPSKTGPPGRRQSPPGSTSSPSPPTPQARSPSPSDSSLPLPTFLASPVPPPPSSFATNAAAPPSSTLARRPQPQPEAQHPTPPSSRHHPRTLQPPPDSQERRRPRHGIIARADDDDDSGGDDDDENATTSSPSVRDRIQLFSSPSSPGGGSLIAGMDHSPIHQQRQKWGPVHRPHREGAGTTAKTASGGHVGGGGRRSRRPPPGSFDFDSPQPGYYYYEENEGGDCGEGQFKTPVQNRNVEESFYTPNNEDQPAYFSSSAPALARVPAPAAPAPAVVGPPPPSEEPPSPAAAMAARTALEFIVGQGRDPDAAVDRIVDLEEFVMQHSCEAAAAASSGVQRSSSVGGAAGRTEAGDARVHPPSKVSSSSSSPSPLTSVMDRARLWENPRRARDAFPGRGQDPKGDPIHGRTGPLLEEEEGEDGPTTSTGPRLLGEIRAQRALLGDIQARLLDMEEQLRRDIDDRLEEMEERMERRMGEIEEMVLQTIARGTDIR